MKKPSGNPYLEKADKLRSFGFNVSLTQRKHTAQQKSAVSRLFKQHEHFLSPREDTQPAKFFRVPPKERHKLRGLIGHKAQTPGGFFIQVPKGVKPRDFTVKISKGKLVEKVRGRAEDHIIPLDRSEVALDPIAAFKQAVARAVRKGKKPRQAQLIVNGFHGKRIQSLKSLLFYLENNPRFMEETDELDEEEFADTFQIKLIYHAKKKRSAKTRHRAKGKRKR